MNIEEMIDFIYDHIPFLDEYGNEIYPQLHLNKNRLMGMINYPFPYNLVKRKKKTLLLLVQWIHQKRRQIAENNQTVKEDIYREKIIVSHKKELRHLPLNFKKFRRKRKKWIMT